MKDLAACRERIAEIQQLNWDLEGLRRLDKELPDRASEKEIERLLKTARLAYVQALSRAIVKMAGMPRNKRAVMWSFYVLGMSITQTANRLHYARRSVLRLKKEGVRWMNDANAG